VCAHSGVRSTQCTHTGSQRFSPCPVPEPNRGGWSRIDANLRCRVSADPGARLSVLAEAGGHTAELVVLVVRHHASGWDPGGPDPCVASLERR
jgi:hypothetical protein